MSIIGQFLFQQGPYGVFLFDDVTDDTVTNMNFGTGDGTSVNWQLARSASVSYATDALSLEPITALQGAPSIFINGVLQNPTTYTIGATGLVTFQNAPAVNAVLTWSGSFYYPCRFKADDMTFDQFLHNWWNTKTLDFISVKQLAGST